MTSSPSATATAVAAAPLADTWGIATPLTPVGFYPKSGILPAVVEVRDQTGPWDGVGQTRQLMLSDGGWVVETIVRAHAPRSFVYELSDFQRLLGKLSSYTNELSDFQRLLGKLVTGGRAEWTYTAVDGGTRVDWTYTFFPRPRAGLVVRGIVRFLWAPYMRRVLPGIVAEVERRVLARP